MLLEITVLKYLQSHSHVSLDCVRALRGSLGAIIFASVKTTAEKLSEKSQVIESKSISLLHYLNWYELDAK